MVARARRQLAVSHRAQLAAQRLGADRHRELVPDPLRRSTSRQRTTPCDAGIGPLSTAAASAARWVASSRGRPPGGFAVDQAIGSVAVEPQHPVPHRLQADAADPRRFAPAATVINHRQRQKPTDLPGIAPRLRQPPQLRRREVARNPTAAAIATSLEREC